jgi:tripartite-type tricarboxylate transporter receptor subunit TctC
MMRRHAVLAAGAALAAPAEIVQRMHAALQAGFADPAVVQRLPALTVEPVTESIAATRACIAADVGKNTALLRDARFQPE